MTPTVIPDLNGAALSPEVKDMLRRIGEAMKRRGVTLTDHLSEGLKATLARDADVTVDKLLLGIHTLKTLSHRPAPKPQEPVEPTNSDVVRIAPAPSPAAAHLAPRIVEALEQPSRHDVDPFEGDGPEDDAQPDPYAGALVERLRGAGLVEAIGIRLQQLRVKVDAEKLPRDICDRLATEFQISESTVRRAAAKLRKPKSDPGSKVTPAVRAGLDAGRARSAAARKQGRAERERRLWDYLQERGVDPLSVNLSGELKAEITRDLGLSISQVKEYAAWWRCTQTPPGEPVQPPAAEHQPAPQLEPAPKPEAPAAPPDLATAIAADLWAVSRTRDGDEKFAALMKAAELVTLGGAK